MFTESNTVEQMILNATAKLGSKPVSMVREDAPLYEGELLGDELRQLIHHHPLSQHERLRFRKLLKGGSI